MIKIRKELFETNSSSVHTLTFLNPKWSDNPNFEVDHGTIIVRLGYFGKDYKIYNSPKDKLSYLATVIWCFCGEDLRNMYNSYYFEELKSVVMDNFNCTGIKIIVPEHAGMDHQTYPDYYGECPIFERLDYETMKNFIFNDNLGLKTNCD